MRVVGIIAVSAAMVALSWMILALQPEPGPSDHATSDPTVSPTLVWERDRGGDRCTDGPPETISQPGRVTVETCD